MGALTKMQETASGLEIEARLALATEGGREAYELAKAGALAFSIGALIQDSDDTGDGRLLKAADLLEVSLVTVPAQAGATIHTVKAFDSRKEFETALRDKLGLSRTQAKRLAAGGFRAMTDTDDTLTPEVEAAVKTYLTDLAQLKQLALATVRRKRKAMQHDADKRAQAAAAPVTFQVMGTGDGRFHF